MATSTNIISLRNVNKCANLRLSKSMIYYFTKICFFGKIRHVIIIRYTIIRYAIRKIRYAVIIIDMLLGKIRIRHRHQIIFSTAKVNIYILLYKDKLLGIFFPQPIEQYTGGKKAVEKSSFLFKEDRQSFRAGQICQFSQLGLKSLALMQYDAVREKLRTSVSQRAENSPSLFLKRRKKGMLELFYPTASCFFLIP